MGLQHEPSRKMNFFSYIFQGFYLLFRNTYLYLKWGKYFIWKVGVCVCHLAMFNVPVYAKEWTTLVIYSFRQFCALSNTFSLILLIFNKKMKIPHTLTVSSNTIHKNGIDAFVTFWCIHCINQLSFVSRCSNIIQLSHILGKSLPFSTNARLPVQVYNCFQKYNHKWYSNYVFETHLPQLFNKISQARIRKFNSLITEGSMEFNLQISVNYS